LNRKALLCDRFGIIVTSEISEETTTYWKSTCSFISIMPEVGTKRSSEPTNYEYDVTNIKKNRTGGLKMRLLLVGRYCGAVVGKGGDNLARMRKEHDVDIDMPTARTSDRVLSVDGEVDNLLALSKEILTSCPQAPYPVGQKCPLEMNLLVSTDVVGMIIGKGGDKLKEIRDQSNGKVKVYQECLPNSNERVVACGGESEEDIMGALKMILSLLNDAPRAPLIAYDPNDKPSEILSQGITGSGVAPMGQQQQGYNTMFGGNSVNENEPFQQVPTVTTITVTNEMCGAIIGKAGSRIREVRGSSGAKIEFSESEKGMTADRVITITGTQHQVNIAEQMMSQCVRNRSV